MEDLTPLQEHYIAVANTALIAGGLAAALIVFLLAVIATRLLASGGRS